MQVKLVTTIETIIDCDPEHQATFEETKREIFGRFLESFEEDQCESITSSHQSAVIFDKVIAHATTHSFVKVE